MFVILCSCDSISDVFRSQDTPSDMIDSSSNDDENDNSNDGDETVTYSKDFLEKFGYNHENTAFAKVKILEIYDLYFNIDRFVAKIEIEDDYFGGLQSGAVYNISIGIAGTVGDTSDPRKTYKAIDVISEYEYFYLYFCYDEIVATANLQYDYTRSEYFDGIDYKGPMREMAFDNYIIDTPAIQRLEVLPIKDGIIDITKLSDFALKTNDEFNKIFLNSTESQIEASMQDIYTLTAPTAKKSLPDEFYNKYGYNAEGDMFVWAQLAKFLPGIYEGHKIVAHICIYEDSYKALSHKLGNYYISIDIGDHGTEAEKNLRASSVKALFSEYTEVFISVPNATEVLTDDLSAFPENDDNALGFFDAAITLDSYRIIPVTNSKNGVAEKLYNGLAEIFGSDFPKYDIHFEETFDGVDRNDIRLFIMKLYARGRRNMEAKE
jgi:hypothetical protein